VPPSAPPSSNLQSGADCKRPDRRRPASNGLSGGLAARGSFLPRGRPVATQALEIKDEVIMRSTKGTVAAFALFAAAALAASTGCVAQADGGTADDESVSLAQQADQSATGAAA
jgi:hypothetical protein